MQLPQQRHQERSLSATSRPNNQVGLAPLEDHFVFNPEGKVSAGGAGSDGSCGHGRPSERGIANADE